MDRVWKEMGIPHSTGARQREISSSLLDGDRFQIAQVAITAPPTRRSGRNRRMGKVMGPEKFILKSPAPSANPIATHTAAVETALGHSFIA